MIKEPKSPYNDRCEPPVPLLLLSPFSCLFPKNTLFLPLFCKITRKTMKGVNYYLNHEKQFLEFLNHGNVPLDNNATESALRNFCMHKHTWRLIDTINGAKASALVYSIVETAKANGLNPFRYLEFLLTEMMEHEEDTDYGFLDDLLPWSESIPDICKIQSKK